MLQSRLSVSTWHLADQTFTDHPALVIARGHQQHTPQEQINIYICRRNYIYVDLTLLSSWIPSFRYTIHSRCKLYWGYYKNVITLFTQFVSVCLGAPSHRVDEIHLFENPGHKDRNWSTLLPLMVSLYWRAQDMPGWV